jgi:hypothetical protein
VQILDLTAEPRGRDGDGRDALATIDFLLSYYSDERALGASYATLENFERMINAEIDSWGFSEEEEILLAAILAERHGIELPECKMV